MRGFLAIIQNQQKCSEIFVLWIQPCAKGEVCDPQCHPNQQCNHPQSSRRGWKPLLLIGQGKGMWTLRLGLGFRKCFSDSHKGLMRMLSGVLLLLFTPWSKHLGSLLGHVTRTGHLMGTPNKWLLWAFV